MLRSASKIVGHRVNAVDGEIGRAVDFLLDERGWFLRYVVVDTGRWLDHRRVLISPLALSKAQWTSRRLVLERTRERVEAAPPLAEGSRVPRQYELELSRHYGWSVAPSGEPSAADQGALLAPQPSAERSLQSLEEVLTFGVEAADGSVGQVGDFILDDDSWTLPYLVVDGRDGLIGRRVLLATERVGQIDWGERHVRLLSPSWEVEDLPDFDPMAPVYRGLAERSQVERLREGDDAEPPPEESAPRLRASKESPATRGLRAALARIIHG